MKRCCSYCGEKSERLVSSVIERRNQSIRRRELRTIPYSNNGKTEVDSEYATTDNEEHIQEQSNQDKSYFDSESIGNQSGGVRQRTAYGWSTSKSCGII